jgi:lipoate-protein ligase A
MEAEGKLKTKVPKSLDERLKSIQLTSMDPEMQGRAKALREKLKA